MQNNQIVLKGLNDFKERRLTSGLLIVSCFGIFLNRYLELFILILSTALLHIYAKQKFNKYFLICFAVLFLHSEFMTLLNGYKFFRFTNQFVLLFVFFYCYYCIISVHGFRRCFLLYVKIAYFISVLGLIQFIVAFFTGQNLFFLISRRPVYSVIVGSPIIRISSILEEPSYLSAVLTPALYFAYYNRKTKQDKICFLVILITFLLTFSAVSYLILCVMVSYILYKRFRIVRRGVAVFISCFLLFLFVPNKILITDKDSGEKTVFSDVTMKITETAVSFSDLRPSSFELLNLSTYAWISNLWVSLNAPSRLFGTGLGSHGESYFKVYKSNFQYHGLNAYDAFSMGIRLFSEFGIIGLVVILLLCILIFNNKSIINQGCAFYILTAFLRGGNYVLYGVAFFITMFIFSGRLVIRGKQLC